MKQLKCNNEESFLLCEYDCVFLDKSFVWLNDPELQKGMDIHKKITREEQEKWFATLPHRNDYKIWGIKCADEPIGACGFRNITKTTGEITIFIGEKKYWGGAGKQILSLLENKASEMSFEYIFAKILRSNNRSKNLFYHRGFVEYGNDEKFILMQKKL